MQIGTVLIKHISIFTAAYNKMLYLFNYQAVIAD